MRFFFRQTSILSLKCFCLIFCAISAFETSDYEIEEYNNAFFISEIFNKYGNNNSITYEVNFDYFHISIFFYISHGKLKKLLS